MKRIGPNLFQAPDGGKIVFANGEARHFPAIDRRPMAMDDMRRLHARDEELSREEEEFGEDDERELEEHLRAAADGLSRRRKARDARRSADEELDREAERIGETRDAAGRHVAQNMDRGRDALPNPKDHRQDFRSGDGRARDAAIGYDGAPAGRKALLGLD